MSLDAKITAVAVLLERIQNEFSPATLASSLGAEDMVLTDLVARYAPGISIFSLWICARLAAAFAKSSH
jgi:phosphoadenosine phosphosulfate reductase